jgi:hypothetical protein
MKRSTLILALFCVGSRAWGAAIDDFASVMDREAMVVGNWFSGQIANRVDFLANAHMGEPAGALGLPNFEAAALAGFAQFKIDGASLNSLNLSAFAPNALSAEVPAIISVPYGRLRAHVGLPGLFFLNSPDLGATVGGASGSWDKASFNLSDAGAELRTDLLKEGLITPFTLSLAATYDYLSGTLAAQDKYSQTSTDASGNSFATDFSKLAYQSSFSDNVVGLRALVSRNLIVATPYFGGSAEAHKGTVETTVTTAGTISQNSGPGSPASLDYSKTLAGAAQLPSLRTRLLGGVDAHFMLFDVDLGAEYDTLTGDFAEHVGVAAGL